MFFVHSVYGYLQDFDSVQVETQAFVAMDPGFTDFTDLINGFKPEDEIFLSNSNDGEIDQNLYLDLNLFDSPLYVTPSPDQDSFFSPSMKLSSEDNKSPSNSDDGDLDDPVLKYISQMLMEENMEDQPCMIHNPMALQDAEKSLYQVLGNEYPEEIYPNHQSVESPDSFFDFSGNSNSSTASTSNSIDASANYASGSGMFPNPQPLFGPSMDSFQVQNMFSDAESIMLFKKGLDEASKFIPDSSKLLLNVDLGTTGSRGKKNHEREYDELEAERSNKQSAISLKEETEISDMFDKVLLCHDDNGQCSENEPLRDEEATKISLNSEDQIATTKKARAVDLRSLLVLCAQAISSDDRRTANELLKQIRQHSSPLGDGSQRLAHYFANALESRLNGSETGFQTFYTAQTFKKTTAADMLKAYQVYLSACPFKKFSIFFANKMILKIAEKATNLHIIDFGITYGFQWPLLIQLLSSRPNGPPKLKITGIELPQTGFRPNDRIEETGARLAKYCERFGVPFEYNPISSQKWETIRVEDLKIQSDEVRAVNCLYRFKNLLDETVEVNGPRDGVLKLIRKLSPAIFVHAVVNGSYNAPFFVSRFKEALFHFSALFDMYDTNVGRESGERLMFEREFYGREVMNVLACEGSERVERPETYKQWQVRNYRAGFRQMPLDQELLNKFRTKLRTWYHKDFVLDEDGNWLLLGWRGRILFASSCWIPA